ncbi:MAG: HNH endonuclease [Terriglobales bacterium]
MLKPGKRARWWTGVRPRDLAFDDGIFLWESSPGLRIVGLSKITKPDAGSDEKIKHFEQQYLTRKLPYSPTIKELRGIPILQDAIFLKAGPASVLSRLTALQAEILLAILRARNPGELPENLWVDLGSSVRDVPALTDAFEELHTEGGRKLFRHFAIERSRRLVLDKRRSVLDKTGALACEVCSFDFSVTYGDLGEGFCEVHHKTPLSVLNKGTQTKLDDLAIVCSNCHRMIHRSRVAPLEIGELKVRLAAPSKSS